MASKQRKTGAKNARNRRYPLNDLSEIRVLTRIFFTPIFFAMQIIFGHNSVSKITNAEGTIVLVVITENYILTQSGKLLYITESDYQELLGLIK